MCEVMWEELAPLAEALGFLVTPVDVDSDPAIEARLGDLVPVLMHGDTEICHYHLDPAALRAYMGKVG